MAKRIPHAVPRSLVPPVLEVSTEPLSISMASHSLLLPCRLLSDARAGPRSGAGNGSSSRRIEAANFSRSSSDWEACTTDNSQLHAQLKALW